jgi:hypothetical protein
MQANVRMKLAILGQPCIDKIVGADGTSRPDRLGGILYSLAATQRWLGDFCPTGSFTALTWQSIPDKAQLDPMFDRFSHLDRSQGLWPTNALTNRVELRYITDSVRTEHCATILPALTPDQLSTLPNNAFDAVFINIISGFDISVSALEWLRSQHPSAHFHLDVHALSLGELSSGGGEEHVHERSMGPVKDWERWVSTVDSFQLNELEAACIAGPAYPGELLFLNRLLALAARGECRARTAIITRGSEGATKYDLRTGEEAACRVPPIKVLDTTGSGDVFGAIFTASIANGSSSESALQQAVNWASWNAELSGIEELLTADLPVYLRQTPA